MESSIIMAIGYDEGRRWLDILFTEGIRYRYLDVPIKVHQGLITSSSKGAYFNARVKGRFLYTQVASSYGQR